MKKLLALVAALLAIWQKPKTAEALYRFNPTPYDPDFARSGMKWNVDPRLLKAIALWEHRGSIRPEDRGDEGHSYGVLQINDFWFPFLNKTFGWDTPGPSLLDPQKNIDAGGAIAAQLLRELGSGATVDGFIQSWSLGAPKVKMGITNPAYLAGVRGFLDPMDVGKPVEV